jgi:hypothetical protein
VRNKTNPTSKASLGISLLKKPLIGTTGHSYGMQTTIQKTVLKSSVHQASLVINSAPPLYDKSLNLMAKPSVSLAASLTFVPRTRRSDLGGVRMKRRVRGSGTGCVGQMR